MGAVHHPEVLFVGVGERRWCHAGHLATYPTSDGQSLIGTSFPCSINSDCNSNICLATSIYKEPSANKADCSLIVHGCLPGVGVALAFPWKWWCYSHYSSQQLLFLPAVMRELWKEDWGDGMFGTLGHRLLIVGKCWTVEDWRKRLKSLVMDSQCPLANGAEALQQELAWLSPNCWEYLNPPQPVVV